MSDLYDNSGNVIAHDDSAPCLLCNHYDDNKKGVGLHPVIIIIQSIGGVIAGISLAIVNLYMLPEYTWMYRETAFIALFIMMPSLALWIILFGLQIMGLSAVWMKLVIWITAGSWVAFGFMLLIDYLLSLPSLAGGAS